jgi:sortase (surface protein transpeptidase)
MSTLFSTYHPWFSHHFPRVRSHLRGPFGVANYPETVIFSQETAPVSDKKTSQSSPTLQTPRVSFWNTRPARWLNNLIIIASFSIAALIFAPHLYYLIIPTEVTPVLAQEEGTPLGGSFTQGAQRSTYMPPVDANLPEGKWIIIPRIGVRTQMHETADSAEALNKGVWLVPDFGQPGDRTKPMIAVAHRYGLKVWWESNYWKYHTFYNLPELEPGDRVEVIADKRKWIYEIYAGEEGEEITDYSADLILYTCKYLNSPLRHFRYARLVDPTVNTQQSGVKP